MRHFWTTTAFLLSLFWGVAIQALDLNSNQYAVYEKNGDLYVVPKDKIIILHGSIATPIAVEPDVSGYKIPINDPDTLTVNNLSDRELSADSSYTLANYTLDDADLNGDGNNDLIIYGLVPNSLVVIADTGSAEIHSVVDGAIANSDNAYFRDSVIDPADTLGTTGTEYLGVTRGQFSVGKDGSANYRIPIDVPPGIKGMEPKLSLNYNSNRGNGLLGWGWSIGGLSRITRCPASLIRDGYISGVGHDDDYKFCLDGQRLVEVAVDEYRTENESFAKIIKQGSAGNGPSHWTVYRRDGTVWQYGHTWDAKRKEQGRSDLYEWHVNRVTDMYGNYILYNYTRVDYPSSGEQGVHRIEAIEYTKNEGATDTQHLVEFKYENRTDAIEGYYAGSIQTENKRLEKIVINTSGVANRSYLLDYNSYAGTNYTDPLNISKISKVTQCYSSESLCAESLDLEWAPPNELAYGLNDQILTLSTIYSPQLNIIGDFDGDGLPEKFGNQGVGANQVTVGNYDETDFEIWTVVDKTNGVDYYVNPSELGYFPFEVMDINGDGLSDVVRRAAGNSGNILVYQSTGSSFELRVWVRPSELDGDGVWTDMNGDSLPDLVRLDRTSSNGDGYFVYVGINNGNGFSSVKNWYSGSTLYQLWHKKVGSQVWVGDFKYRDFNGDGLADAWVCDQLVDNSTECVPKVLLNTGDGYLAPQTWGQSTDFYSLSSNQNEYFNDVNGDGLQDQIIALPDGLHVSLSTGEAFAQPVVWETDVSFDHYSYYNGKKIHSIKFDRLNDDECDDLILIGYDNTSNASTHIQGVYASYSRCNNLSGGFTAFHQILGPSQMVDIDPAAQEFGFQHYSGSIDINGDGFSDLPNLGFYYGLNQSVKQNIVSINKNKVDAVEITYQPISNELVHEQAAPSIDTSFYASDKRSISVSQIGEFIYSSTIPLPKYVVDTTKVADGIGGDHHSGYFYIGHRYHKFGYGSLGFERIARTDFLTNSLSPSAPRKVTTNYYTQAIEAPYVLIGELTLSATEVTEAVGNSLVEVNRTAYNWDVRYWSDDIDNDQLIEWGGYEFEFEGTNSPHYHGYIASTQQWFYNYEQADGTLNYHIDTRYKSDGSEQCDVAWYGLGVNAYAADSAGDVLYDDHGNLLWQQVSTCDTNNLLLQVTKTESLAFDDVDTSSKRVFGLLADQRITGKVFQNGSLSDSKTRRTQWDYNNSGYLLSQVIEPGTALAKTTSYSNYNAYGTPLIHTESWVNGGNSGLSFNSRTTTLTETVAGDGSRTVNANQVVDLLPGYGTKTHNTQTVYDGRFGEQTSFRGVDGLVVNNSLDALGRPVQIDYADGTQTLLRYRECNNCLSGQVSNIRYVVDTKSTGAANNAVYYDGLGRERATKRIGLNGDHIYQLSEYDSHGRLSSKSEPYSLGSTVYTTGYHYDYLDRINQTDYPNGSSTEIVFNGLVTTTTNPLGQIEKKTLNGLGQLVSSRDADDIEVAYTYEAFGQLATTKVDGRSDTVIILGYDVLGRKTSMSDPDSGNWTYSYNALDLLSLQKDGNNHYTQFSYDQLGRQIQREWDTFGVAQTATWLYDTKTTGLLSSLTGIDTDNTHFSKTFTYTDYGLVEKVITDHSGTSFTEQYFYDQFNRRLGYSYPNGGLVVGHDYNDYGHRYMTYDAKYPLTNTGLWLAQTDDARGNITDLRFGNNVTTNTSFQPDTGLIDTRTGSRSGFILQDQEYLFDAIGNLKSRIDHRLGLTQSFCYDDLNRLKQASFSGCSSASSDHTYDALGNLTNKAGSASAMLYGQNGYGPHAITKATIGGLVVNYSYDNNGQMLTRGSDVVSYTPFGKPNMMSGAGGTTYIAYGADERRNKRSDIRSGSDQTTTYYVGDAYEKVVINGVAQEKFYVGDFALYTLNTGGAGSWQYLHRDHIGSVVAISNDNPWNNGDVVFQGFDAWGTPLIDGWNGTEKASLEETQKGFTNHEHLMEVKLIHMNGRVYDPVVGRFLSPDPLIQDPANSQSYNRYSYVLNNPLSYTDPTGYESQAVKNIFEQAYKESDTAEEFKKALVDAIKQYAIDNDSATLFIVVGVGDELFVTDATQALDAVRGGDYTAAAASAAMFVFKPAKAGVKVVEQVGEATKGGQKLLPAPKVRGNPNRAPENGTIFVDSKGNAIVTPPGGRITGSPDGKFIQARDANNKMTGVRKDGGHNPANHPDLRAQQPHGHVPGVSNPDGTPWLPIKQ